MVVNVESIREVGGDGVKVVFLRDDQNALLEALYIEGFSEEKYRRLRRYIKERLGEEFSGIVDIGSGKALGKVLLMGVDLVGQALINDIIELEAEKASRWLEGGTIKELVDKVLSEVKEAKKTKKSKRKRRKKKSKRSKSRSKSKPKKSSRRRG